MNKGTKVQVISESAGWSKINYNNKIAYVSSGYLKTVSTNTSDTKPEDSTEQYKEIKVVNTNGLNVRKGPSTSYSSIGKLNKGSNVEVISESAGWSKINYNNNNCICSNYVFRQKNYEYRR